MHLSKYIKIYSDQENPDYLLFYSTRYASKVLLHKSLLESIEKGDLSPDDEETLSDLGFLVPDLNAEREEMIGFMSQAEKNRRFNVIAVLNLECNLACRYCFEGKMKGRHYMSLETADMLVDFAEHQLSKGKDINIDFYGGEPLLSIDIIKYISRKLKASAQGKGLAYTFGLVTNGTLLTRDRTDELLPWGFTGAKVTLDGPRDIHDKSRPFKSGAGTFEIIIRNIIEVCERVKIQIGGNYTQDDFRDFPRLLDSLIDAGITPDNISAVKFDPVTKVSERFALPDFRDGAASLDEPWIAEASIYLRDEILKRGFETYQITASPCAVEFRDDIIINYDGTFYKCPAFIGMKELEAGSLTSGVKDYAKSHNLDVWKNEKCLDCAYLPICFGGCRFLKLLRDGSLDDVDCKRQYLDATLETFIRQDMTYGLKAGDK